MYRLYSAKWCSVCDKLKKYMEENLINFEVKDIDEDLNNGDFIMKKNHHTIPQVYDANDNYIGDCKTFISKYESNKIM